MIVLQLDQDGYFVGTTTADPSPLEPGVFLIPGNCIDEQVPNIPEGYIAKWGSGEWVFEKLPEPKTELPTPPTSPPPPVMHMADFRLALLAAGLLEQVEAFMAGPDVSPECKILWEYATQVHRDDQYLNQMAGAMGFTDAQIDAVFGIDTPAP